MTTAPLTSVCIASHNHGRFLRKTLDSILSQTYPTLELIVVDDASRDDSRAILEEYARAHPDRMRLSFPDGHVPAGVSVTANRALALASGRYVAWTGSDDLWEPTKLEEQVAIMEAAPGLAFVCSPAVVIDENEHRSSLVVGDGLRNEAGILIRLLRENPICCSSVLIRKALLDDAGLLKQHLLFSDWELWIRLAARGAVAFLDKPNTLYRVHGTNVSVAMPHETRLQHAIDVLEAARREVVPQLDPSTRALARRTLGTSLATHRQRQAQVFIDRYYRAAEAGHPLAEIRSLGKASRCAPFDIVQPRRLLSLAYRTLKGLYVKMTRRGRLGE